MEQPLLQQQVELYCKRSVSNAVYWCVHNADLREATSAPHDFFELCLGLLRRAVQPPRLRAGGLHLQGLYMSRVQAFDV